MLGLPRLAAAACLCLLATAAHALDSVPKSEYRTRRMALADKIHSGVAILFASPEPTLDFMPYRQDEDFYYLTGWNEPGAALMVVTARPSQPATDLLPARAARPYREILFLPMRNLRTERFTGVKMDASITGVQTATGVDEVLSMAEMPTILDTLAVTNPDIARNVWGGV